MQRVILAAMFFSIATPVLGLFAPVRAWAAPAPACLSFRGRLEMSSASPAIRIARIDSKDVFGVPDGKPGHEMDGIPANVRALLRPDQTTKVFGDFDVCPINGQSKTPLPMVRITKITVVAVMNPRKPN